MARVTLYRDPNVPTSTVRYGQGPILYTFDPNAATVDVEEEHAAMVVRDCEDLRRSKVKLKAKVATKKEESK